jgi:hypothetical protein
VTASVASSWCNVGSEGVVVTTRKCFKKDGRYQSRGGCRQQWPCLLEEQCLADRTHAVPLVLFEAKRCDLSLVQGSRANVEMACVDF